MGLHIDNGFMRENESQDILSFMQREHFDNLKFVDASQDFLIAVGTHTEPEVKRKIIGDTFLAILNREMSSMDLNVQEYIMAQGTTYPDTIESGGTKNASTIKTHHNRVPAILEMIKQGKVIEPLAELYKDEVRSLGLEYGIPHDLVWRHPFPGPGLAVRVLCQEQPIEIPSHLKHEIDNFTDSHHLKGSVFPFKSVGVQGDKRTYAFPLVIQKSINNWQELEKNRYLCY